MPCIWTSLTFGFFSIKETKVTFLPGFKLQSTWSQYINDKNKDTTYAYDAIIVSSQGLLRKILYCGEKLPAFPTRRLYYPVSDLKYLKLKSSITPIVAPGRGLSALGDGRPLACS